MKGMEVLLASRRVVHRMGRASFSWGGPRVSARVASISGDLCVCCPPRGSRLPECVGGRAPSPLLAALVLEDPLNEEADRVRKREEELVFRAEPDLLPEGGRKEDAIGKAADLVVHLPGAELTFDRHQHLTRNTRSRRG
jgi:hypothetical protein